jgi:hypothetical protein
MIETKKVERKEDLGDKAKLRGRDNWLGESSL